MWLSNQLCGTAACHRKIRKYLERVQKAAIKVILGTKYATYKKGLKVLKIDSLEKRRNKLCLSFAKKSAKHEKIMDMFPIRRNNHQMSKRYKRKYETKVAKTERYTKSAIPYMTKPINDHHQEKNTILEMKQ